jgi:hypothetical protein
MCKLMHVNRFNRGDMTNVTTRDDADGEEDEPRNR